MLALALCLIGAVIVSTVPFTEHVYLYTLVALLFACVAVPLWYSWARGHLDYFEPIHVIGGIYFIYFGLGAIWTAQDPSEVAYDLAGILGDDHDGRAQQQGDDAELREEQDDDVDLAQRLADAGGQAQGETEAGDQAERRDTADRRIPLAVGLGDDHGENQADRQHGGAAGQEIREHKLRIEQKVNGELQQRAGNKHCEADPGLERQGRQLGEPRATRRSGLVATTSGVARLCRRTCRGPSR